MQGYFHKIADYVTTLLQSGEVATMTFDGEESEFVRLNHNSVRQAGSVRSSDLTIDLINGAKHAEAGGALSGVLQEDKDRVAAQLKEQRDRLAHVPDDPHLLYATEVHSTERVGQDQLAPVDEALAAIMAAGQGRDLVGIYGQGPIYRGFANSFGQRNWFTTYSFNFDWCFYLHDDKAVKTSYAGFRWDPAALKEKMEHSAKQLDLLGREPKTVPPGKYRVYLSPVALADIGGIMSWMGFGIKAHRAKISSLIRMSENGDRLHPSVTICENTKDGIFPNFDSKGFIKPDRVTMIEDGVFREYLISARSAKEFDVPANGAEAFEAPRSLDIAAGDLPASEVLAQLGTGAYINNLHYLNYSDRPACRVTGMTRFATFWVEDGKLVAPLNVMRFDESVYRMLGENLVGLTREREMILSSETYGGRSCDSVHVPGALIKDFAFTL